MPMGLAGAMGAAGKGALTPAIRHSKLGRPSGGGGKSPKKKKTSWAIIAIILVIGLIAGGYTAILQGLFGILDDDDKSNGYWETRLYVRATDAGNPDVIPLSKVPDTGEVNGTAENGSSSGSGVSNLNPSAALMTIPGLITAHAASSDDTGTDSSTGADAKAPNGQGDDPTVGAISDLSIALTTADKDDKNDSAAEQDQANKSSSDKEKADKKQDDSSGGDLNIGPTNNYGIAYTVLSGAANGAFTYACPPQFAPDSSGRPTNYQKSWDHVGATIYDSYTCNDYTDTGTSYHLREDPSGNACNAGFARGNIRLSGVRNSASDTWHIVGIPNAGGGDESKVPFYSFVYVYNNAHPEASYGAAICADSGGGLYSNNAIIDQYMPSNKYYGRYGLNVSPGQGFNEGYKDHGSGSTVGASSSYGHYFAAFGINGDYAATMKDVTVFVCDGYTNKHSGLGKEYSKAFAAGQNWPGVSGNPVALNAGSGGSSLSEPSSTSAGAASGQYEITYSGTEESAAPGKDKIEPYSAGTKDAPFTTYIKSKKGTNVRLEFWIERIYIGPGENASVSSGDYSDWANTHFPKYYCFPPKGQNAYKAPVNPGRIDNSDRNALPNCVAYAWGLEARKGHILPHWGDADKWASGAIDAGYSVDRRKNPRVGDVFCLAPTCHVGVVIGVDQKNGKVITAESDFSNQRSKNDNLCVRSTRSIKSIPYFIHMK